MRSIFSLITFIILFASASGFSQAISCSDGKPEGMSFLVVTNTKVLASTQAVYIQKLDVQGEFPTLLGLYQLYPGSASVSFSFAEAGNVDWSKVDKKACFTKKGNFVMVQNLKLNNKDSAGDYVGEIMVAPRIEIRPGFEKTCPVPHQVTVPPRPVTCNEVDLP